MVVTAKYYFGLLISLAVSGCVTLADLPTEGKQAAECMANILRSAPNVEEVRVTASQDQYGLHPVIDYRFIDKMSKHYRTRFDLTRDLRDGSYTYSLGDTVNPLEAKGTPIGIEMVLQWQMQCGVGGVLITA